MNTRKIGTAGETLAEKYLKKQGYKILQKNFVAPHGEIDIVAKDGDYIVFVEVKRRKSTAFEAVDARKQRTIVQCAKFYLAKNNLYGVKVRFDVVGILQEDVSLIKDAFRA